MLRSRTMNKNLTLLLPTLTAAVIAAFFHA